MFLEREANANGYLFMPRSTVVAGLEWNIKGAVGGATSCSIRYTAAHFAQDLLKSGHPIRAGNGCPFPPGLIQY